MKTIFVAGLVASLAVSNAFAGSAPRTLERAIARDLTALLSDTVNEGDQTAEVLEEAGAPRVACRFSKVKSNADQDWAFCHVSFRVSFEGKSEERECGVLYRVERAPELRVFRSSPDLFRGCVETLSESLR